MSDTEVQIPLKKSLKSYRTCFVPLCGNNSNKNPDKVFVHVPSDMKTKQQWFSLARRGDKPTNSHFYCCQDHLNIETDLENYIRFKLFGGPIKLKDNVLPRYFDCQPDRQITTKPSARKSFQAIKHKAVILDLLSNRENSGPFNQLHLNEKITKEIGDTARVDLHSKSNKNPCQNNDSDHLLSKIPVLRKNKKMNVQDNFENLHLKQNSNVPSIPKNVLQEIQKSTIIVQQQNQNINMRFEFQTCSQRKASSLSHIPKKVLQNSQKQNIILKENQKVDVQCNFENNNQEISSFSRIPMGIFQESKESNITLKNAGKIKYCNKNIQVNKKPPYRSVGLMAKCKTAEKSTSTSDIEAGISKLKINHTHPVNLQKLDADLASLSVTDPLTSKTISEYKPSSGEVEDIEEVDLQMKRNALNLTLYFIANDPKRYIGVPQAWFWIIENLSTLIGVSTDDIKLTLMKIKLNDTFVRLGHQFGVSSTKASNVFNTTVLKLANVMKKFIYFPDRKTVIKSMPIQFRANYYHVRAIIDAFEIEIQKPSNSTNQALTWSEYKKGNTLKFLISCSPDGFINFISRGYGGRISDTHLYKISKLDDK